MASLATGSHRIGRRQAVLATTGFLLVLCAYSWLFVSAEVLPAGGEAGGSLTRFDLQLLLLTNPIETIAGWCAGDLDHFGMRYRLGVLLVASLVVGSACCLGHWLLSR